MIYLRRLNRLLAAAGSIKYFYGIGIMTALYISIIAVLGVIILVCAALFLFAYYVNKMTFGARHDKNPLLKYFTAEDFGLKAEKVDITCKKNKYMRGVIYKKDGAEPKKELLIFCHGMGPGHIAYTTEIAYFCNLGYTVLAPDYYGCNLSDGKNIKDIDNGKQCVLAAILYATENLGYEKLILVGHSWGGHSALCAANHAGDTVSAVVSVSAPDRSEKVMHSTLKKRMPKFLADMVYPFLCLVCGGESSAEAAENCPAKVLLIHGECDPLVSVENSAYGAAKAGNITKILAKGKRHNPYNTVEAEKKLSELTKGLSAYKRGEVGKEFFENFDFAAATEEDIGVMGEIARFLANI